jgi:hypothetical protein
MPMLAAGPLRTVTGWGLFPSLLMAVLLTVPPIALLWRGKMGRAELWAALPALFASCLLYNRYVHGIEHTADAGGQAIDGAVHVYYAFHFARTEPAIYEGFVSLYGFWALLGGRIFAWNASHHLAAWAVAAAPMLIIVRRGGSIFVGLLASFATLHLVILPVIVLHHASGFWAHLFALLPLTGIWLVDALEDRRWVRMGALLFLVGLTRYTYGLNLTELFLTVAALCLLEAGERQPLAGRILLLLLAAALAAGARHALLLILPVVGKLGWIIRHDAERARLGQLTGAAALLVASLWRRDLVRALRVPLLFGAFNAVLGQVVGRVPNPTDYYHQKYDLPGVILVGCGLVVAVAGLVPQRMDRRALAGVLAVVGLAFFSQRQLHAAVAAYDDIYREVAFGKPPFVRIQPWTDPGAVEGIDAVLVDQHKEFGGYRHRAWFHTIFTSSIFGIGDVYFRVRLTMDDSPGHCTFWEEGSYPEGDSFAKKECRRYRNRHETVERGLCARCN